MKLNRRCSILFHLRGTGREVADADLKPGLSARLLQLESSTAACGGCCLPPPSAVIVNLAARRVAGLPRCSHQRDQVDRELALCRVDPDR